jgi:hypothetical protein
MKFLIFSTFVGYFCPSGSGSNMDPDPKHWFSVVLAIHIRSVLVDFPHTYPGPADPDPNSRPDLTVLT